MVMENSLDENSLSIANFFIEIANREGAPLTPLKLQKLIYYAHGWSLGFFGEPLIDEMVEAWKYGPVIPSIYQLFKHYGNQPIKKPVTVGDVALPELKENTQVLCEKVWGVYGQRSGLELSSLTHKKGTPWSNVTEGFLVHGKDIPNKMIQEYFESNL